MYYIIEGFIDISLRDNPIQHTDYKGYEDYLTALTDFVQNASPDFEVKVEQNPGYEILGFICDSSSEFYRRVWILTEQHDVTGAKYMADHVFLDFARSEIREHDMKKQEVMTV